MNVGKTLTLTVVVAWLAFAGPTASAAQERPELLPRELWREYPLDPTGGREAQQSEAPALVTTTAERPTEPAAQAPTPAAQEERSNLWRMLGITIGLAALAGILAALVVIGASSILARGRTRWRLIRARGSAPKRERTSGRLVDEGFRSESGSLVPLAERSRGGSVGRQSRKVEAPKGSIKARKGAVQPGREAAPAPKGSAQTPKEAAAAVKEAPPARRNAPPAAKEAPPARKDAAPAPRKAPPPARPLPKAAPKALPKPVSKTLPKTGAPPPKKQLPGLAPPKKEGVVPTGPPHGKVLPSEHLPADLQAVKRPEQPSQPARPEVPSGKVAAPEPRALRVEAPEQPRRPEESKRQAPQLRKVLESEARAARGQAAEQPRRPVQPVPQLREARVQPAETPSLRWERCQVEWWRGYVTSDFYALAVGQDGEPYVAGRSPRFRWWGNEPPPQRGRAGEAHARLLEWLAEEGWEATETRGSWYGTRLRRRSKPTLRELSGGAQQPETY